MTRSPVPVLMLVAAGFLLAPGRVFAQKGKPTGPPIRVTPTPATIAFPTPGIAEFDLGHVDQSGVTVAVRPRPNKGPWELRIRADAPDMGGYGKPVSDILWRPEGSSTWRPLSTTDDVVIQGQSDQDVVIYFRLLLDWTLDEPNTYSANIVFTATHL
jgi:hypothetical protein